MVEHKGPRGIVGGPAKPNRKRSSIRRLQQTFPDAGRNPIRVNASLAGIRRAVDSLAGPVDRTVWRILSEGELELVRKGRLVSITEEQLCDVLPMIVARLGTQSMFSGTFCYLFELAALRLVGRRPSERLRRMLRNVGATIGRGHVVPVAKNRPRGVRGEDEELKFYRAVEVARNNNIAQGRGDSIAEALRRYGVTEGRMFAARKKYERGRTRTR